MDNFLLLANLRILLGRVNGFIGFHIFDFHSKIIRFLKKVSLKKNVNQYMSEIADKCTCDKNWGTVPVAPYGGLFFHKKLIDIIGYPMEDLFLYQDDFEYTYRITKNGGKIYLILNSTVKDLEKVGQVE